MLEYERTTSVFAIWWGRRAVEEQFSIKLYIFNQGQRNSISTTSQTLNVVCYVMKHVFLLIFIINLFACKTEKGEIDHKNLFQLIIPDTTNNNRAKRDLESFKHVTEISKQLNLRDIAKGVDSLEIRAWYSFSFSNSEELYSLKFIDTTCLLTYYRIYTRDYNYDEQPRKIWNPFSQPIVDSAISKTIILKVDDYKNLHIDRFWNLKSESQINIPDSIGFTDCESYSIEIADTKKYKFIKYHCPNGYYEKLKKKDILDFLNCFSEVQLLIDSNNARIQYKFD